MQNLHKSKNSNYTEKELAGQSQNTTIAKMPAIARKMIPATDRLCFRWIFDNADERKVAVAAGCIEAITNNEVIRHDKTRVFDL